MTPALENLPGLHLALEHVSLSQGNWRLPAILQQWAAHIALHQVSGSHTVQVYSQGGAETHPPGAEGSATWITRSAYSRGCVLFKTASSTSSSYAAVNIDAKALGQYLRRSTPLELPSCAQQAILRQLEATAGHVMYWAAFTSAAHPVTGIGVPICWHPTLQEVGQDMHPVGATLPCSTAVARGASWQWWGTSPPIKTSMWCTASWRGL